MHNMLLPAWKLPLTVQLLLSDPLLLQEHTLTMPSEVAATSCRGLHADQGHLCMMCSQGQQRMHTCSSQLLHCLHTQLVHCTARAARLRFLYD